MHNYVDNKHASVVLPCNPLAANSGLGAWVPARFWFFAIQEFLFSIAVLAIVLFVLLQAVTWVAVSGER